VHREAPGKELERIANLSIEELEAEVRQERGVE
jgi:hypothetical protein